MVWYLPYQFNDERFEMIPYIFNPRWHYLLMYHILFSFPCWWTFLLFSVYLLLTVLRWMSSTFAHVSSLDSYYILRKGIAALKIAGFEILLELQNYSPKRLNLFYQQKMRVLFLNLFISPLSDFLFLRNVITSLELVLITLFYSNSFLPTNLNPKYLIKKLNASQIFTNLHEKNLFSW